MRHAQEDAWSRRRISHFAFRISCSAIVALLAFTGAVAEEEPFAKDEGETPAESLRKALRKMSRVEESAQTWLQETAKKRPEEGNAGAPQLFKGIQTRQKEIEEDLARLVLKLQKG